MIKTKDQLKRQFANGTMPNGDNFANLIDTMAQEGDISGLATKIAQTQANSAKIQQALLDFETKIEQELAQLQNELGSALNIRHWLGEGGRFGLFDTNNPIPSATTFATLSVPADGNWHPVLTGQGGCIAFEVVASVAGAGKAQAITHGMAVCTANGSGLCSIRQTRAHDGWAFWHRISFRWQAQQLQVKTHSRYTAINGQTPMIQYGITRLW